MDITKYKNELRKLFPTAAITVHLGGKIIKYELKITPSLSEKEHDAVMPKIRKIFGKTLLERYTEETGHHFFIHQKNG